jgi:hydrogenase/urease accessory protein HupE
MGIEHIIGGYDHLLFLLCLLLVCRRRGASIAAAVTAFTAGHSVSLALVTLGVIGLPPPPVEATIALSVMILAAALARDGAARMGRPWTFAAAFGVLHGFGFAGALAEVGLPSGDIPLALVSFNIGVEVGQLAFVVVALLAALLLERVRVPVTRSRLIPYAIGTVASFWLIERVVAFWSGGLS